MNNQEITQNNELIAKFMELGILGESKDGVTVYSRLNEQTGATDFIAPDEMRYEKSWDWLMTVIQEIERIGAKTNIGLMFCNINYVNPFDDEKSFDKTITSGVKINAVNGVVIEFINWYNENK